MTRRQIFGLVGAASLVAAFSTAPVGARTQAEALGQARLPRAAMANGQRLAAGTYTVRVTVDKVSPVVGQTPAESRWVEFLQGDQVRGREMATVMTAAELAKISAGRRPAAGAARVDVLRGNDYLRVWFNHAGTHYLVHLAATQAP